MTCCRSLLAVLALVLPMQVSADAPVAMTPDTPIVMQTFEAKASFPAPPWTDTTRIRMDSETDKRRALTDLGTDLLSRTYVPKGQHFDNWNEIYGMEAETPMNGSAQTHRNTLARSYTENCTNAVMAPVVDSHERQVFILFCPALQMAPDTGEIAVMVYSKQAETLLKVFYHRRVPAFDLADEQSLPATQEEMKALVRYMNQAQFVPS